MVRRQRGLCVSTRNMGTAHLAIAKAGRIPNDYQDGTNKTLFIGEVLGKGEGTYESHYWVSHTTLDTSEGINGPNTVVGGTWPTNGYRDTGFASHHPGGCHFLMGGGSVAFYTDDIDQNVLNALTTRSGGEVQSQ